MFRFLKQVFVSAMILIDCNVSGINSLNAFPKCISMNNQERKKRPEILNINSTEALFYLYSIKVNK